MSTEPQVEIEAPPSAPPWRPVYAFAKRTFDVVASGLGLVCVSPILLIAAVAIRLESPGGVLFVQQRVGRNFRPFRIYKFRTMLVDSLGPNDQITFGFNPRITRVGRFMRKTKIDELPQLINVLLGHMSLVGPRPELPKYVEMFRDDYAYVLSVRPGVTDLASVKYRNETEELATSPDPARYYVEHILPDKIALARQYIDTATFSGDLAIVVKTIVRIVRFGRQRTP